MSSNHKIILIYFVLILFYFKTASSDYNKLEWSLCGSSDIDFKENSLNPMVIVYFVSIPKKSLNYFIFNYKS